MSEPWRDINDPGPLFKPKPETDEPKKPNTGIDDSPADAKEPLAKEYRFKEVSIVESAQGFERNKPFDIEGSIELLGDKVVASKILLYPIGLYNGQEDNFVPGGIEADLDTSSNTFCGTCDHLFDPDAYANDKDKPADATWKLFVRAKGAAAEKPMESEQLTFPKPSKFVELRKGHYDENGASAYNKPQSGDDFKPNEVVKALQGDFIKICLLPDGSKDGFFGDQTDAAVRKFQHFAIKSNRMKRNAGTIEKTDTTLDKQQPDGVVDKTTRDELDRWLQNDWIKPIPTLRHGEYDDTGVNNGKGKRGTDDHHQGTPVVDNQKNLQSVYVYTGCAQDGWFFDKMKDAVKLFQEAAGKGEFMIDGVLTDIGEKLTGYRRGDLCPKTQEYLQTVVDKGGKVPKDDVHTDWKNGFGRNITDQNKYNDAISRAAKKNNVDPFLLKSLIAQESSFDPKSTNNFGFAGLTQIGGGAIQDAGLSIGATAKINGQWVFDFNNDERFMPEKSINGGAVILTKKHNSINKLVFSHYTTSPSAGDQMKFVLAAYNSGEKTISDAYAIGKQQNASWEQIINRADKVNSPLWKAIPEEWGNAGKYSEITQYVDNIIQRKNQ
jgi:hypothetical protein